MNINIDDVCSLLWDKVSTLKNNDKLWIGLAGVCNELRRCNSCLLILY